MNHRKIVPIVEGDGDFYAVPAIMRRIIHEMFHDYTTQIDKPIKAKGKGNILRLEGVERYVNLASSREGASGVILVFDADELCPVSLRDSIIGRLERIGLKMPVSIVLAKYAYEAWFLADAESLSNQDLMMYVKCQMDCHIQVIQIPILVLRDGLKSGFLRTCDIDQRWIWLHFLIELTSIEFIVDRDPFGDSCTPLKNSSGEVFAPATTTRRRPARAVRAPSAAVGCGRARTGRG
jgi:hypothetical protein